MCYMCCKYYTNFSIIILIIYTNTNNSKDVGIVLVFYYLSQTILNVICQ